MSQPRISRSNSTRCKTVESAGTKVLNRSVVTIPAKDWEAFKAWSGRPAEVIPALAGLARRTPSWEGRAIASVDPPRSLIDTPHWCG